MSQICEITKKKIPHISNLPEGEKGDPKSHRRLLLKRKVKVPEIKGTVSLKVTAEGLKEVNAAGGLAKYLKDADDKKLSTRLLRLKRKIHGEPKPEKPSSAKATEGKPAEEAKAEAAPAPAAAAAPAEKPAEAKAEEKPAPEEKKEAAPAEKPAEEAKAEAAPAEEKKEETPAAEAGDKPAEEAKGE